MATLMKLGLVVVVNTVLVTVNVRWNCILVAMQLGAVDFLCIIN